MNGRRWTEEDTDYLINNYFKQGVKLCARKLNRTNIAIERKVQALGLYHKSKNKTTESYIDELIDLGLSICPIEDYKGAHVNILHEDLDCGHVWSARPTNILSGKGCPSCAPFGFDPTKSATLYFIKFYYEGIQYYKLGITNKNTRERHVKDWANLNMEIIWERLYEIGQEARQVEYKLKNENACYKADIPALTSGGNSEIFTVKINEP